MQKCGFPLDFVGSDNSDIIGWDINGDVILCCNIYHMAMLMIWGFERDFDGI